MTLCGVKVTEIKKKKNLALEPIKTSAGEGVDEEASAERQTLGRVLGLWRRRQTAGRASSDT